MSPEENKLQDRRDEFISRIRNSDTPDLAQKVMREIEASWYWLGRAQAADDMITCAGKIKKGPVY